MPEDQVTTESLRQVLFNLSRRIRDRIHSLARKTGMEKPSPDQIQKLFQELQQVCRHIDASYELNDSKTKILVK